MTTTTRRQAILFISLTVLLWGIPALFIHYFADHLDAHTQNFWRYFSACVFLFVYAFWTRQPRQPANGRAWMRTAVAAATLVAYQACFAMSLYHAKPGFIVLLIQLELPVAIGLSCLFFDDERHVVKSPWFIVGACAALAGAVGMVVFSPDFSVRGEESAAWDNLVLGILLVGGAAVFWATYSVAIKWCLEVLPPFPAFIRVEAIATAMFLVLAVKFGTPGDIVHTPRDVVLLVVVSGIACIGIAQIFYTYALGVLGVAVCNTAFLATCVVAAVLSRIIFGEILTPLQIVSGLLLLAGAAAAIQAGGRNGKKSRRQAVPTE